MELIAILLPSFAQAISYLAGALLLIVLAYVVVRTASFAYFRTKLEYLRSVLKELNGGRN